MFSKTVWMCFFFVNFDDELWIICCQMYELFFSKFVLNLNLYHKICNQWNFRQIAWKIVVLNIYLDDGTQRRQTITKWMIHMHYLRTLGPKLVFFQLFSKILLFKGFQILSITNSFFSIFLIFGIFFFQCFKLRCLVNTQMNCLDSW